MTKTTSPKLDTPNRRLTATDGECVATRNGRHSVSITGDIICCRLCGASNAVATGEVERAECLTLQREHNAKQGNLGSCVILPIGHEAEHNPSAMRAEIAKVLNS